MVEAVQRGVELGTARMAGMEQPPLSVDACKVPPSHVAMEVEGTFCFLQ